MTIPVDAADSPAKRAEDLRQRAEEKLSVTGKENPGSLHELQVHQIELEMQNEELRRAQAALETARARYFDLYDLAPVGYLTLGEQNIILETNLTAATLLGLSRDALVKQPLTRFIEPEDQDIFYQCRRLLIASRESQVCELRMIRRASTQRVWVRVQIAMRQDDETQAASYHAILSDLSRQKLAEKNLIHSEEQFRAVTESATDAIFLIDAHSRITYWNRAAETLFGYGIDEILGKPIKMVLSERFYRADQTHIEQFDTADEKQWVGKIVELYGLKKDGVEFPMELSLAQWIATGGKFFTAIVRDITPRKRAEETARFLAQVNDVLASSLDYETTLASIVRLAVPHLADWCAVYITLDDGTIQQLALTHVDPTKVEHAQELTRRYLDDPNAPYSVPNVIQTGRPELAPPFTDAPDAIARKDAILKTLPDPGLKSLMVVPLIAPGRTFGAITFVSAESGRSYGQDDLALAQDLARRAALAVDNARLYHTAQLLNLELDQRVAKRTRELEQANQQLRLLAGHIQSAREDERIKIARSIHDELGTLMTAIKMDLSFLGREISGNDPPKSPEALREEIKATTKLVDDAIEVVHQIARELRPGVLDHLGLRAALEWQVQEFQEHAKIECVFSSDLDEIAIDQQRSTAVFRIMQETLTNVVRHAQATCVRVNLRQEAKDLILEVRDNGKGMSDTPGTNRFGILGMRERAHVFGGDVMFQGAPGKGTLVTVRIPV